MLTVIAVLLSVLSSALGVNQVLHSRSANETDALKNYRVRVENEATILKEVFRRERYNPDAHPLGSVRVYREGLRWPVVVTVLPTIYRIPRIDDRRMEFNVEMGLKLSWKDDRLYYFDENRPDKLILKHVEKIWKPIVYFEKSLASDLSERRSPSNMGSRSVVIESDGTVNYGIELTVISPCKMDFQAFPFDAHRCDLILTPDGYNVGDVEYKWKEGVFPNLNFEGFCGDNYELWKIDGINPLKSAEVESISRLRLSFYFTRLFGYYLYGLYLPTVMLVVVSWTAFFMHPSKVAARALLGVAVFVAFAFLCCTMNATFPSVPYLRVLDVWTIVSSMFIFNALVETVLVTYFYSECRKEYRNGCVVNRLSPCTNHNQKDGVTESDAFLPKVYSTLSRNYAAVDHLSRLCFPAFYALFMLIYLVFCFNFSTSRADDARTFGDA